jgi:hypothetical protein
MEDVPEINSGVCQSDDSQDVNYLDDEKPQGNACYLSLPRSGKCQDGNGINHDRFKTVTSEPDIKRNGREMNDGSGAGRRDMKGAEERGGDPYQGSRVQSIDIDDILQGSKTDDEEEPCHQQEIGEDEAPDAYPRHGRGFRFFLEYGALFLHELPGMLARFQT